jgi:hypothetical protein
MKIVSGGQTGVDRAALDTAIALGVDYGGWCPAGGWAEDMPNPPGLLRLYPGLRAIPEADPAERTRWNVRDSNATLILVGAGGCAASPGTELTVETAAVLGRPWVEIAVDDAGADTRLAAWLDAVWPAVLNIGGPRESEAPGIYRKARRVLAGVLAGR